MPWIGTSSTRIGSVPIAGKDCDKSRLLYF
jgi:hypothetical protein